MKNIVVAGAGTMGVVLTRLFAQYGWEVTLWNRRQVSLDKAREVIARDLTAARDQGALEEAPETVQGRIAYTTDFAVYETAGFVIENIAEDLEVKHTFWEKVSALVPETALLTTNTSGLRVSDIARAVKDPGRFCGMHFWNPPDLLPLVEITKGEETRDETAQAVRELALSLEKRPVIVKKDILGILGNRLQYAVLREALHILAMGAAGPEEIDAAMKYGPGFRYSILGPFETGDLGGVDILNAVSQYLFPDLGAETESQVLAELTAAGRLGVKAGAGFYDYAPGEGPEILARRNRLFREQWELLKDRRLREETSSL